MTDEELVVAFGDGFESLTSLTLDGVDMSGRATALAEALGSRLERVSMVGCKLGDGDVEGMVRSGMFERAKSIDVSSNAFGARGLDALSRQQMSALERLRVWPSSSLGREEAEAFARRGAWSEGVRWWMLDDLEGP